MVSSRDHRSRIGAFLRRIGRDRRWQLDCLFRYRQVPGLWCELGVACNQREGRTVVGVAPRAAGVSSLRFKWERAIQQALKRSVNVKSLSLAAVIQMRQTGYVYQRVN